MTDEGRNPLLQRGVSLRWLISFCDEHDAWNLPTHVVCSKIVKPATAKTKTPYVSLLKGRETGVPDVFISHAWGNKFGLLVAMARKFISDRKQRNAKLAKKHGGKNMKRGSPRSNSSEETNKSALKGTEPRLKSDSIVWIDIFAITQHPGDAQKFDLEHLESVIKSTRYTLVVLDAKSALPLTRCWCIFEMFVSVSSGIMGKMQIRAGRLVSEFGDFVPVSDETLARISANVSAKKAEATIASDKAMILKRIEELNRGHRDGMHELNRKIKRCVRHGW